MGRSGVDRAPHVEPEGGLVAAGHSVARFCRGERATSSGIERRAIRIALTIGGSRDLRTAAKARVDKPLPVESRHRRRVVVAMLALPARRGKAKPEPREVVDNGGLELRFAARPVQIFNAQQHASVAFGGDALIDERGIGVAEMKRPVWRWRKAQDGAVPRMSSAMGAKRIPKPGVRATRRAKRRPAKKRIYHPGPPIADEAGLLEAAARLRAKDPELIGRLIAIGGPPPLRRREAGFAGMAAIIVAQQVSTASASAIFGRLQARIVPARGG